MLHRLTQLFPLWALLFSLLAYWQPALLVGGKGDFVLDASTSDVLILLDQDGGSLYLAEQGDPNVLIEPVATLDQTRRFAHVFVSDFSELQLLARGDVAADAVAAGFY